MGLGKAAPSEDLGPAFPETQLLRTKIWASCPLVPLPSSQPLLAPASRAPPWFPFTFRIHGNSRCGFPTSATLKLLFEGRELSYLVSLAARKTPRCVTDATLRAPEAFAALEL